MTIFSWLWRWFRLDSDNLYEAENDLHRLTTGRSVKGNRDLPDSWRDGSGR